jgi:hypothetical protein
MDTGVSHPRAARCDTRTPRPNPAIGRQKDGKETKFSYDPDSDLKATVFPSETKDEDTYAYNDAGEMSEVKMLKGTETLA